MLYSGALVSAVQRREPVICIISLHYLLLLFSHKVMSNSVIPWTAACQAPLSVGFPRQEHWSGFRFPSPRDLPDPESEPVFPAPVGGFFTAEPPGKPHVYTHPLDFGLHFHLGHHCSDILNGVLLLVLEDKIMHLLYSHS